eukprot:Skav227002  [mRNA]  locus=scaffold4219:189182:200878:- [translate_table: standard]
MRPDPEQKPTEIAQPVEATPLPGTNLTSWGTPHQESEEVRLQLGHFVASLLRRCSPTQIYSYIDEATGLIRAQAMDPFHEVKALACHWGASLGPGPLGKVWGFLSCLTHNHAKIRIAALRAVTACLWCGVWKHNFEIFQVLMAWQDPNKVPIKAFYEGVTNVNYMSTLSFDRHPAVRRFWFETLTHWMLRCVTEWLQPMLAALTKFYSGRAWAAGDARRTGAREGVTAALVHCVSEARGDADLWCRLQAAWGLSGAISSVGSAESSAGCRLRTGAVERELTCGLTFVDWCFV